MVVKTLRRGEKKVVFGRMGTGRAVDIGRGNCRSHFIHLGSENVVIQTKHRLICRLSSPSLAAGLCSQCMVVLPVRSGENKRSPTG